MDWMPLERYRERHQLPSPHQAVAHALTAGLLLASASAATPPAQFEKLSEGAAYELAERDPHSLHVQLRCQAYVIFLAESKAWQIHLDVVGEFIPFPQHYADVEAATNAVRKEAASRGYRVVDERHGRLSRTFELSPCL